MWWFDSAYDTSVEKYFHNVSLFYGKDLPHINAVFTLYNDETKIYKRIKFSTFMKFLKMESVIGVEAIYYTDAKTGRKSLIGYEGYSYNSFDREICEYLDADGWENRGNTHGYTMLIPATESNSVIGLYQVRNGNDVDLLKFGINHGDKLNCHMCSLPFLLRYALVYGSRHFVYYNDDYLLIEMPNNGLRKTNDVPLYYRYRILDKKLLTLLAKYKLSYKETDKCFG